MYWDTEPLLNISGTMLVGLLVVIFAFGLAQPIAALASTATRSAIGIAVAVILLSFLTMITRRKAMSQVVGFLSMENGLFFGAMSATYGMPMIVEFGVALDVLVAVLVLGVFFFQIREQFDSLDLHHLESLQRELLRTKRAYRSAPPGAGALSRAIPPTPWHTPLWRPPPGHLRCADAGPPI